MSAPEHGQLSALVSLIADATKIVEAHFAKSPKPYVPSLNDIEPHPLDITSGGMELRLAIQTIEGACSQLIATVTRPAYTIFRKMSSSVESACLDIVTINNVPGILHEHQNGLHIEEIAKKTGINKIKLGRVMRALATRHVFREASEDVFVNNRLSVQLVVSPGLADIVQFGTQEVLGAIPHLNDVFVHKDWAHSFEPHHAAFNKRTGFSKGMFDWYSGEESELGGKHGNRFSSGLRGWATVCEAAAVLTEYPWKDLPKGTKVVDLGSGKGALSIQLAKHHPHLQLFLQDRPERMKEAEEDFWPLECPEAIAEGRVHFNAVDFHKQPPIPGADIYYMTHVLHDWEDGRASKLLANVRSVMAPHSRILLYEHVVRTTAPLPDDKYVHKKAPEPLLPNYGMGRVLPHDADMIVMLTVNGSERQLSEHISLGEKAGLKFIKLWDLGSTGIMEFGLA